MWNIVLYYLVGGIAGLGFELVGAALDMFEGLQGFWCWVMTTFLDFVQESAVAGISALPFGGFFDLADVTKGAALFVGTNEIMPVFELGAIALVWLSYQFVWIAVRTVLKLVPGIA